MQKVFRVIITLVVISHVIWANDNLENGTPTKSSSKNLDYSAQWFIAYQNGKKENEEFNAFMIKRGYVTISNKFSRQWSARITQDITVDEDGDGEGDIEIRLKYGYLRYSFNGFLFFTKPNIEIGLVHCPAISFEQNVNLYRVQGTMYLERFGIRSSADYGITVSSLLGGELDDEYKQFVSSKNPGKYGSLSFGMYNGGGYHAIEKNKNKFFEGRLTLRPFPFIIPGFQVSYFTGFGKSNLASQPTLFFNSCFVSFESSRIVLTGMYYNGKGDQAGKNLDKNLHSLRNEGFSLFGELKLLENNVSLIGRVDYFNLDISRWGKITRNFIGGIAYHFLPECKILLDFEYIKSGISQNNNSVFEAAIEFNY